jgi:hypothetical protein
MSTLTLIDSDLEAALLYIQSLGFSIDGYLARYSWQYDAITGELAGGAPIFGKVPITFSAGGYKFFTFNT